MGMDSPIPDLLVGVGGRDREHVDVVAGEGAAEEALRAVAGSHLVVLNGGEVVLEVANGVWKRRIYRVFTTPKFNSYL